MLDVLCIALGLWTMTYYSIRLNFVGLFLCFRPAKSQALETFGCKATPLQWLLSFSSAIHACRQQEHDDSLQMSEGIVNVGLLDVEERLAGFSKSLSDFPQMPLPNAELAAHAIEPVVIRTELAYNKEELADELRQGLASMNIQQKAAYDAVREAISHQEPCCRAFFLDGLGGTGKTFLYNHLLNSVRAEGQIALAVASSGIAAILLRGGQTAHKLFSIPIPIDDRKDCGIGADTVKAQLLRRARIVIWDEAPMADKRNIEAVSTTLQDLMRSINASNADLPFGGKVFLLGGDFRQCLPVVPRAGRARIVNSCLLNSGLWPDIKVLKLHINMRAKTAEVAGNAEAAQEQQQWADYLQRLGEGTEPTVNVGGVSKIRVPDDLAVSCTGSQQLIDFMYGQLPTRYMDQQYVSNKAILTTTNSIVDEINEEVMSMMPTRSRTYYSCDTVSQEAAKNLWPVEFLNGLNLSGIPPHKLVLKIGAPIMLMRNMDRYISVSFICGSLCPLQFHSNMSSAPPVLNCANISTAFRADCRCSFLRLDPPHLASMM